MKLHTGLAAAAFAAFSLLTVSGCAVSRGQETTGDYIDDKPGRKPGFPSAYPVGAFCYRICRGKTQTTSLLFIAILALFFAIMTLVLAVLFVIAAYWDTPYRLHAVALLPRCSWRVPGWPRAWFTPS